MTALLECVDQCIQQSALYNDCSIKVYCIAIYYVDIMLNAFSDLIYAEMIWLIAVYIVINS